MGIAGSVERRIDFANRLVYIVEGGDLCVLSAVAATECFGRMLATFVQQEELSIP